MAVAKRSGVMGVSVVAMLTVLLEDALLCRRGCAGIDSGGVVVLNMARALPKSGGCGRGSAV